MANETADRVRHLVKGSGLIMLGLVLELGLSFLAKVLMARILGKTDYGAVTIGIVLVANVGTLFLLGLNAGVARYLPRFDDITKRRGVVLSAFHVVVPLSVAGGLLIFAAADPISRYVLRDPSLTPIIRIFALAIPFASLMKLSVGGVRGAKRSTPKVLVRNIVQPVVRFTLIIAVLYVGLESLGVAWAYLASYVAAGVLGFYFAVKHTPLLDDATPANMHRELLSFSSPLAVKSASTLVFSGIGIDTLMISYFAATGAVGVYNVVFPIAQLLTTVSTSFAFLFMPVLSELHADGATEQMRRLFEVISKWLVMATLPMFLVLFLFPDWAIGITFGAEYASGAAALSILSVGFFVHTVAGPNEKLLQSIGRTRFVMYGSLVAAAVNVAVNLTLVPQHPLVGAATGTTVAYIVLNGFYAYYVYRTTGIHPVTEPLVRPAVAALAVFSVTYLTVTTFFRITTPLLLSAFAVMMVVYGVIILRFGAIEEEEVMLVLSFEERFDVDLTPLKRFALYLMD